jgi:hypothetical protein
MLVFSALFHFDFTFKSRPVDRANAMLDFVRVRFIRNMLQRGHVKTVVLQRRIILDSSVANAAVIAFKRATSVSFRFGKLTNLSMEIIRTVALQIAVCTKRSVDM